MSTLLENEKTSARCSWRDRLVLLILLHEFHEGLLMHQACILAILQHAEIPQAQFGKTLVNEVDGGVDIQGDRGLLTQIHISIETGYSSGRTIIPDR